MLKRLPQKTKTNSNRTSSSNNSENNEIKIETTIKQKIYFGKNDGEYVDYEEVK